MDSSVFFFIFNLFYIGRVIDLQISCSCFYHGALYNDSHHCLCIFCAINHSKLSDLIFIYNYSVKSNKAGNFQSITLLPYLFYYVLVIENSVGVAVWGGDPVYPTVNYIQDPDEVIDFRGPDFHEPTPNMLDHLKEVNTQSSNSFSLSLSLSNTTERLIVRQQVIIFHQSWWHSNHTLNKINFQLLNWKGIIFCLLWVTMTQLNVGAFTR